MNSHPLSTPGGVTGLNSKGDSGRQGARDVKVAQQGVTRHGCPHSRPVSPSNSTESTSSSILAVEAASDWCSAM